MDKTYFHHVRTDIAPLLPARATRILDVGAGAGRTSAWLRTVYPGCRTVALEGDPANLGELKENTDDPHIVDLNGVIPDVGAPDLILLLDVLEHLMRPEDVLNQLTKIMAADGTVIVSCPNVAHASVSVPLLLRAQFEYQDSGILDRTHLRFFVRKSAVALLNQAGLVVQRGIRTGLGGPRTRWLDRLTAGALRDRLTKQYIMAGRRAATGVVQGKVDWLTV
jgi:2-polyprenyl-3-methyl-5-hydroxy-6-metoxy-1,4-benzoquinol methylase